jgi:hypothetical protein
MPYQSTWQNPYMPQNGYQGPLGQSFQYQQPVNGIVKVNGRDSALQYQLPPNSMSPALFDQNGKTFYIVSTDGTGMKTVEAFDFTQHVEQQPVQLDGAQFVSKQEYDQFVAKVSAALEAINGVHEPISTAGTASAVQSADGTTALNAPR